MSKPISKKESERIKENEALRSRVDSLVRENARLQEEVVTQKRNLQIVQDYFSYEIIEYFTKCNNLRNTAEKFGFETVGDCYEALKEYCGCSDTVQSADDYKECYKEIFGWEYEEDTDDTSDCSSTSSRTSSISNDSE